MAKRQLTVKVSSIEDSLAHLEEVWEHAEQGKKAKAPIEIVSFANATLLIKTLTPKRLELLQQLHALGKSSSIRTLAKKLDRDYSNVHQDVKILYHAGLVLQDKTGKYSMPWDKIVTEVPMTLPPPKETTRHHRHSTTHAENR